MHAKHYRISRYRQLLAAALAIFFTSPAAATAQLPGHWELAFSGPHWVFTGMQFHDSFHGVVMMAYGTSASLTTSDAGAHWLFTNDSGLVLDPIDFHAMDMPTDSNVYILSDVASNYSSDGGVSWRQYKLAIPVTGPPSSWRIFPHGIGRAITIADQQLIWTCSDSARYFYDVQSYDGPTYDSIRDAIILDTNQFWVSNAAGEMVQTLDGGKTWSWISVIPGLDTLHSLAWISTTPVSGRFYVTLDRGIIPKDKNSQWDSTVKSPTLAADFVETTDDGGTWRIDSSLGSPRIYQLESPGQGKLWAFVGPNPSFYLWYSFRPTLVWPSPAFHADSLLYSPDDGRHWFEDTTFLGDTLMQMCWPDSAHGYIAAERNDSLLVYRFVPQSLGIVRAQPVQSVTEVYPNPAAETVTIAGAPLSRMSLLDILGRDALRATIPPTGTLTLDVSGLPRGMYEVLIQKGGNMLPSGKLALH